MSQATHSVHDSGEPNYQHSENAQFEAKFDLSWRDLEVGARLNTVGTAVSEGAAKLEAIMQKILELTKVVAVTVLAYVFMMIIGNLIKSKL